MQSSSCPLSALYTLSAYSFVLSVSIVFSLPPITFVSSFSSFFIRRICYVATSLIRRGFNYRNGLSVFRFDCRTYYSRCTQPSSSPSSPSSTVFSHRHSRGTIAWYRKSHFLVSYIPRLHGMQSRSWLILCHLLVVPYDYSIINLIKLRALSLNIRDVVIYWRRKEKKPRDNNSHWHNNVTFCRPQLHGALIQLL